MFQVALGTNPICVAAPSQQEGDDFLLDMATCVMGIRKVGTVLLVACNLSESVRNEKLAAAPYYIEMERRKGLDIPEGWAVDSEGLPTTDATKALKGSMLPLGGTEELASYRGFGLGMMVEVFCGILSGSLYGPHIRNYARHETTGPTDLGQCFVALDPGFFEPGFTSRLTDLMNHYRSLEPVNENNNYNS
ncbi:delta(1)-pyrroline-2-carboxylate reductase-like [Homarus americanus]|uniref:delta(1)-pyrroline-2-carboxylate reductase-like n=1 Tax=Homarus americanus TaxID=6706 RepID=UPI001C494694|nr:delta(1)-pyrroline-2-carboxylate reductase-like [Homarus americanus]